MNPLPDVAISGYLLRAENIFQKAVKGFVFDTNLIQGYKITALVKSCFSGKD
jgi:hypothetical protein